MSELSLAEFDWQRHQRRKDFRTRVCTHSLKGSVKFGIWGVRWFSRLVFNSFHIIHFEQQNMRVKEMRVEEMRFSWSSKCHCLRITWNSSIIRRWVGQAKQKANELNLHGSSKFISSVFFSHSLAQVELKKTPISDFNPSLYGLKLDSRIKIIKPSWGDCLASPWPSNISIPSLIISTDFISTFSIRISYPDHLHHIFWVFLSFKHI